jgi:poly(hydroxyalkanoate) granule-associated protein
MPLPNSQAKAYSDGMSKTRTSTTRNTPAQDPLTERAEQVKDSAQHIWLAGLGAFAKAQAEGAKVFEALVTEGQQLQSKTQAAAQARIQALSQATEQVTEHVAGMANELSDKATGQWNKLESIFETRVASALQNLGMPTAPEILALQARIQVLEEHIAQMHALSSPAKARANTRRAAPTVKAKTPTARARKT